VYETYVTVTGVVASEPRAVRLEDGLRITSFRVASTTRRRERGGDWVDGSTTWLTVTCWRALATNAAESVHKKDRVVVHGRLRTRDWVAADGTQRTSLEVDADAVGHDLSFGTSVFARVRRVEPVESGARGEADELARQAAMDCAEDELAALISDEPGEGTGDAAVAPHGRPLLVASR
jgi:single-strand DNA-binding protein